MTTHLFRLADHTELPEVSSTHQFNENAVRHVRTLTQLAGLERTGLHIARLTKGCESTEHHTHTHDEEFLVVLSGRGKAVIGDECFDIQAGDLMAFPAGSPAHSMSNPFDDDLVYAITKRLWSAETLDRLREGHPKGSEIKLEFALTGLEIPLHPGAERFYREAGVLNQ